MKQILVGLLAVMMLAFLVSTPAEATNSTKTGSWTVLGASTPGQVSAYTWTTATWAASADTFYFTMPVLTHPAIAANFVSLGVLSIETQSANGDSFGVAVRYQISTDGTSWKSITVGTDSTSYPTTSKAADAQPWTLYPIDLLRTTYWGIYPYMRVMIFGYSTWNVAGGKVRLRLMQY